MGKINEWSQEKGVAGNATKLEKNVKPEFKILLISDFKRFIWEFKRFNGNLIV